ncbi:glycosyl transferase, partial [Amycolatopsis lurida]
MVPLAWALRTAGHEVRIAGQPAFTADITKAGLTAVPVGRDAALWRVDGLKPDKLKKTLEGLHSPWDVVEDPVNAVWDRLVEGHVNAIDQGHKPDNFPMIAGLVELVRTWRPDLVIWEPLSYAGAIAAKACGAAHARLLWSIDIFGVTRDHFLRLKAERPVEERTDPLADWLGAYGRKYGFDFTEDMTTGHFTIDPLPPSVTMHGHLHYLPVRYTPYGGPAVVPDWLHEPPDRPRIGLTLGTSATEHFADYGLDVGDILHALADLDVEVVATLAEAEQAK